MKSRLYFLSFFIIVLFIELLTLNVSGNGVVIGEPLDNPILRSVAMVFIFIVGTTLEYLIFKYSKFKIMSEPRSLLLSFFKINLITFPLTQILAYIVQIYFLPFFWAYILIIEILVVIIEWALLKIELDHNHNIQIESNKILFNSFIANFVSFLFGLLTLIPPSLIY